MTKMEGRWFGPQRGQCCVSEQDTSSSGQPKKHHVTEKNVELNAKRQFKQTKTEFTNQKVI